MGYSSLVSKANISPNYKKRTRDIDSVSIHCACSNLSLDSMGEIYKDPKRQSSANYGIDSNGDVALFVDEKNASMCTSSHIADNRSISIMVSSMTSQEPYAISDFAYSMLVDLLTDICLRNNIKELKWKNDKAYGLAASHGGPVTEQNIFIHSWIKESIIDPGEWLLERISQITQIVNAQLAILESSSRRIIFVGDSRADGMHKTIGNDSNLWITNQMYGFSWVNSDTVRFEQDITDRTAVCILGGAKDILHISPKDYAEKINIHAQRWFQKGCPVYFASVSPVSRNGYEDITNAKIEKFNSEIGKYLTKGIGYIDTYNSVVSTFIVPNGYDYDDNTNKEIYNTIIKTASRMTSGIQLNLNLNLNPTNFHPYVVTFGRDAKVNYSTLTDLRVIGAIIEAGFRYDSNGNRTQKFDNPNIESQIENLEKCGIAYGMYTICRARSVDDAKTEMKYFQYQTYRHPPKLGVWLHLNNLTPLKVTNDSLIEQYNKSLDELGFRGKMGIMCTRSDLEKMSWDKWQNEFYLYLIDHVSDLSVLDNLLDPQLFDTDGTEPIIPTSTVMSSSLLTYDNSKQAQIPATVNTSSFIRRQLVNYAFEFLGTAYVLGASGMKPGEPLDCGQFVCAVYYKFNMDLRSHRTTITQSYGQQVSLADAQPGDVVHYPYNPKYSNAHVAIYIGENKIIEATSPGGVQVSNIGDRFDRIVNIIDYWRG